MLEYPLLLSQSNIQSAKNTSLTSFVQKRLPKWLQRFNTLLVNNPHNHKTKGNEVYFVGSQLCYADLAVFHALDGLRSETGSADGICAEAYEQCIADKPLIAGFMRQIEERPRIQNWRKHPHRTAFTQTGPGF
jgi:hypothetical protein